MFNFMKKGGPEREEKEKRKKEKKERKDSQKPSRSSMTAEELLRLDEVRRSLKIRVRRKDKEKLPSGITADYSATFFASLNQDGPDHAGGSSSYLSRAPSSPSPSGSSWHRTGDNLTQSDSSEASLTSFTNPPQRSLPPLPPRPPARGILKVKPSPANSENAQDNSDSIVLVRNTLQNEVITYQNVPKANNGFRMSLSRTSPADSSRASDENLHSGGSGDHSNYLTAPLGDSKLTMQSTSPSADSLTDTTTTNSSFATPPFSLSPVGEGQGFPHTHDRWNNYSNGLDDFDLSLPPISLIPLPKPRVLTIQRQPRGDFGFSLRRAMVVERLSSGRQHVKAVIFAEPGQIVQHKNDTGLLPGDRLLEVNGILVDDKSREEIIDMIKSSNGSVTVKVQPVPELSELTRRSGHDGAEVELDDANIRGGTLRRSGSRRFKKSAVSTVMDKSSSAVVTHEAT